MARKAKTVANIYGAIYDGNFDINFDCVGVEKCRFALCSLMPPDGSEECTYREHGSCRSPNSKLAALEGLRDRLTKELKQLKEDFEG